jgi:osmotically inducible lipoprotein OsmB
VKKILLASTFAIALAGCGSTQTDRTLTGAALGGVAGAAIGGAATGTGGGAAAGAAIGALGGAAIGASSRPRYDRCYIDDYGREICRGY